VSVELLIPTEEQAPELAELVERHAQELFGEGEVSEQEVRHWFGTPGIWMRTAQLDGALSGYLDVVSEDDELFNADIRTLDRESAAALVAEAERYAREKADSGVVRGWAQGGDPVLAEAFDAAGWRPIRHSFQMRIELSGDLPEPGWPEGLSPRNFRPGEEERVYEADMDAFADHWDFRRQPMEQWRHYTVERHGFDPSLWWLVEDRGELAGIALNAWHFSDDPRFGWVGVLGVRKPWRRRGLGTALLRHSFRDFRTRGATKVGLGVDGENTTGAVRLYERAGMHVVRRTDIYEKAL
jgi:mycothiol synthase